jgi:hypothetical protein
MDKNDNFMAGFMLIFGIIGVFYFDFRVDTLFYALSWMGILWGAFTLNQNKKGK